MFNEENSQFTIYEYEEEIERLIGIFEELGFKCVKYIDVDEEEELLINYRLDYLVNTSEVEIIDRFVKLGGIERLTGLLGEMEFLGLIDFGYSFAKDYLVELAKKEYYDTVISILIAIIKTDCKNLKSPEKIDHELFLFESISALSDILKYKFDSKYVNEELVKKAIELLDYKSWFVKSRAANLIGIIIDKCDKKLLDIITSKTTIDELLKGSEIIMADEPDLDLKCAHLVTLIKIGKTTGEEGLIKNIGEIIKNDLEKNAFPIHTLNLRFDYEKEIKDLYRQAFNIELN